MDHNAEREALATVGVVVTVHQPAGGSPAIADRCREWVLGCEAVGDAKEALHREAIDLCRGTVGGFAVGALAGEADALRAVARLLHEAAAAFSRADGVPVCRLTTAPAGMGDEPLVRLGRELRAAGVRHVAGRLALGVREGQVRSDADCGAWARYVGSVVQGLSVQARDGAPSDALTAVATVAASALDGLRREDPMPRP